MTAADLQAALPALAAILSRDCVDAVTIRPGPPVEVTVFRAGRPTIWPGSDLADAARHAQAALTPRAVAEVELP